MRQPTGTDSGARSSIQSSAPAIPATMPEEPSARSYPASRQPAIAPIPASVSIAAVAREPSARSVRPPSTASPRPFRSRWPGVACRKFAVTTRHVSPSRTRSALKTPASW